MRPRSTHLLRTSLTSRHWLRPIVSQRSISWANVKNVWPRPPHSHSSPHPACSTARSIMAFSEWRRSTTTRIFFVSSCHARLARAGLAMYVKRYARRNHDSPQERSSSYFDRIPSPHLGLDFSRPSSDTHRSTLPCRADYWGGRNAVLATEPLRTGCDAITSPGCLQRTMSRSFPCLPLSPAPW